MFKGLTSVLIKFDLALTDAHNHDQLMHNGTCDVMLYELSHMSWSIPHVQAGCTARGCRGSWSSMT